MILNKNTMENLGQRMTYLMEIKQLNPNKLSLLTNIHATTIKNYVDNKGKPDNAKLDKIASVLDISAEWLKTGNGSMESQDTKKPPTKDEGGKLEEVSMLVRMLNNAHEEIRRLKERLGDDL